MASVAYASYSHSDRLCQRAQLEGIILLHCHFRSHPHSFELQCPHLGDQLLRQTSHPDVPAAHLRNKGSLVRRLDPFFRLCPAILRLILTVQMRLTKRHRAARHRSGSLRPPVAHRQQQSRERSLVCRTVAMTIHQQCGTVPSVILDEL